jgi:hypothetical protein
MPLAPRQTRPIYQATAGLMRRRQSGRAWRPMPSRLPTVGLAFVLGVPQTVLAPQMRLGTWYGAPIAPPQNAVSCTVTLLGNPLDYLVSMGLSGTIGIVNEAAVSWSSGPWMVDRATQSQPTPPGITVALPFTSPWTTPFLMTVSPMVVGLQVTFN